MGQNRIRLSLLGGLLHYGAFSTEWGHIFASVTVLVLPVVIGLPVTVEAVHRRADGRVGEGLRQRRITASAANGG
jgi:hypothetical protein